MQHDHDGQPPNINDTFLDIHEAATRLRVSRRTLDRMVNRGEIGYVQLGARKVFTERILDDYIRTNFSAPRRKPTVDGQ